MEEVSEYLKESSQKKSVEHEDGRNGGITFVCVSPVETFNSEITQGINIK